MIRRGAPELTIDQPPPSDRHDSDYRHGCNSRFPIAISRRETTSATTEIFTFNAAGKIVEMTAIPDLELTEGDMQGRDID